MKVTRTIKLKFLSLNQCKAQIFAEMTVENTRVEERVVIYDLHGKTEDDNR